jgi:1-acyl-sn-glycerol-3-phosphate acyltransferase
VLNRWLRRLARLVARLVARVECAGLENIPESPPYIVVTNHLSVYDVLVLGAIFPDTIRPFAAAKHRSNPLYRFILEAAGVVWVRRGEVDRSALRAALAVLGRGEGLGMAPEGTRARREYVLQRGKVGAAYLATRADVPVVPVGLAGVERVKRNLPRLRRTAVWVNVGEPMALPECGRVGRARLEEYTDEIMRRVASLLPESYRGVYSEVRGRQ